MAQARLLLPPPPEMKTRLLKDVEKGGNGRHALHQMERWVCETARIASEVGETKSGTPDVDQITVFWIRAYGTLADLRKELAESLKLMNDAHLPRSRENVRRHFEPLERVISLIDETKALFDDDEKLYFEWRRHTECHPLQHAYRLTRKGDGALKDKYFCKLLGSDRVIEDIGDAAQRVVRRYKRTPMARPDEMAIAVDFAIRSAGYFKRIHAAVVRQQTIV
jgi:hypothetical protein